MNDSALKTELSLQNVYHRYGTLEVVKNLNLTVRTGEILVLVGPSGCGKTTILNLLSGYIRPAAGEIRREGIVRTVYQKDGLFPWLTVAENILLGLRTVQDRAWCENELKDLVRLIHLEGFENHYPHQLSGGMRQRVELARVLAGDSDILLMDEPFSALDYQTRLRLRGELIRLIQERPRTIVFVTHDIEEAAQLADRVMILTARPASISRELHINASKPRDPTSQHVIEAMKEILNELGLRT